MTFKLSETIICEKCGAENKKGIHFCASCANPLDRDYYRSLWLRNMLITIALFIIPSVILYFVINMEISTNFERQIKNGLNYSVATNFRIIQSFLDERKTDLLSLAKSDIAGLSEVGEKAQFFRTFIREKPWFDLIAVANRNGDLIFSTDRIKGNIRDRDYFSRSNRGEFYNSGIFYSDILGRNTMILSLPFYNRDNRVIGVIFGSVSLTNFYNLILDLRFGKTSEIFLVDRQGRFLSPSRLGGSVLQGISYMKQDANPHVKDSDILIHRDYRGQKVFCAYRKFETPDWFLVSEMDLNEALAPVMTLKRVMFYTFFIAGIILLLSSLFFSRQVLNTLKGLTRNLKTALDDISEKKNTINTINVELRKRLQQCQALSQELKNSEEHIKNVINSISSGLVAFDEQYHITYYNEFFKNFTTAMDLKIGDPVSDRLSIFIDVAIREGIAEVFRNNKPFRIDRHPMRIAGENLTVSIHTLPIRGLDRTRGAILLINDITEQEFLRGQMADYEKLSALSQLALGAAHEINNPLQGITSYLELLLEEENDAERKRRAKEVIDNAYRISETVRGLLNFARPTPPKFTKVQVNKLISETVSFLHHQPLFRKLEIRENLNPDLPSVTADANQIRQVMINILLNAAQAITDNGVIIVTTGKMKFEDRVEIIVADTGIGVPPENLGRLFEPFFTTKKGSGTGLGLSISYSYIKNHGGDISITSDVKNGTEVRIVLPIRQKGKIHSEVIE